MSDRSGGWFFHLAIGAGALFTQPVHYRQETRTDGTTATVIAEGEWRFTPLVAEQIGIGLRTARLGAVVVKGGLFASGILYRILVDSAESEAFVGGLFVALDVDDDIEFYLAGSGLVYPPEGEADATVRFGVSAGVQIPLSAYLEAL